MARCTFWESLGWHHFSAHQAHAGCWLVSWVALHEEECPEQMENLTFMRMVETLYKHSPQHDCHFSATTKEGLNILCWDYCCAYVLALALPTRVSIFGGCTKVRFWSIKTWIGWQNKSQCCRFDNGSKCGLMRITVTAWPWVYRTKQYLDCPVRNMRKCI